MILEGTIAKLEAVKSAITVRTVPVAPQAAPGQAPPPQPAGGGVKETALTVKREATITLDGKKVNLLELRAGQKAKVTYEGTTASSIQAWTK